MSLSRYASAAGNVAAELVEELAADEEFQAFADLPHDDVLEQLMSFRIANGELVERIATAAPAHRRKLLARLDRDRRFWALAAAAQLAFEVEAVLDEARSWLHSGAGYREMIGLVRKALDAPLQSPGYVWPFPWPRG